MHKTILKPFVLTALSMLMAASAVAQVRADLGPLHIRIANEAPPHVRYEDRGVRPHHDDVWIGGYWDRQENQWAWISGRWEQPTDRHAHWIKARYQHEGSAWRYEPAHWSHQQLVEGDDYRQWKQEHHSDHERRDDDRHEGDTHHSDGDRPRY